MATYTYLACDLRTNAVLAELPLTGVRFGSVLNGSGTIGGQLALTDSRVRALDPISATLPARTALFVDRDGVLVWGGVLWTRRYENGRLTLGGAEFLSYFARRRIVWAGASYAGVDQVAIARDLLMKAQAQPGGDIGVAVGAETSGVLRDRIYPANEMKPVAEAVQQLAAVQGGFDFAIDVRYGAGGAPEKVFVPSYPRRGRTAVQTGHVFAYPGNVQDGYSWPEDGTELTTQTYAAGQGEGVAMKLASSAAPGLIDAGYPLLERVESYKDVADLTTLAAHAAADQAAFGGAVVLPVLPVRADLDPVLGSYITGDDARVQVEDERFPTGLDTYLRIVAFDVTPGDDGGAEQVLLTMGGVLTA